MKKRLLAVIGCSLLSIMVLAGCNKKVQNPPPPADNNGVIHNNDNNGVSTMGSVMMVTMILILTMMAIRRWNKTHREKILSKTRIDVNR